MVIKKIKAQDLQIGMYVDKVNAILTKTSFKTENFYISCANDIQKLVDSNIAEVFVDTSRKLDTTASPITGINEETFEVKLCELEIGRDVPVDIFVIRSQNNRQTLLHKGDTFSEEVEEICNGSEIDTVEILVSQKKLFDEYQIAMENEKGEQQEKGFSGKYLDNKKVEAHYAFMDNYMPINLLTLIGDTRPPFEIFIKGNDKLSTILRKDSRIEKDKLGDWVESNLRLFIHKDQKENFRSYMLEHTNSSGDEAAKAAFVREGAKLLVEDLAGHPRSEKIINDSKQSISDMTDVILNNPNSFYGLMKINNYDYYTFTHSVNVATLSIALAASIGVTEEEGLHDLGLGALLHDIGKTKIDNKLINKPGKLTETEFKTVTNHVTLGYEMIKENSSIPKRAFYPLLLHHEKLSGKGYPNKWPADDIHMLGRIIAIIDIYDALTTERTYKKAFTPFDALSILSKNEDDYDKDIFTHFVELIQKQAT